MRTIDEMPDKDTAEQYAYIDDEILVLDRTPSVTGRAWFVAGLSVGLAYFLWALSAVFFSGGKIVPRIRYYLKKQCLEHVLFVNYIIFVPVKKTLWITPYVYLV